MLPIELILPRKPKPRSGSAESVRSAESVENFRLSGLFRGAKYRALWPIGFALAAACAPNVASSPAAATVRILVYNIHAGKDAGGTDNLERVAQLLRHSGADIALLQEVDKGTRRSGGVDQPAVLARLTGFHVAFGKTLDYQGGEYGIAIVSRWPIRAETLIALPVSPPQERAGGSYEPRGAQRVVIASPFGDVVAINTHLDASSGDNWRRQEVHTVLAIADSARARPARLLVGGDFNSTPESAVQDTINSSALRDAWRLCGRGDGFTYPAKAGVKRIDYLYIEPTMRCVSAEVLESAASDHRPLLVHVRF
jgi:endonuclease/exonuclease/phosphatase family metal-dependent hydrolase